MILHVGLSTLQGKPRSMRDGQWKSTFKFTIRQSLRLPVTPTTNTKGNDMATFFKEFNEDSPFPDGMPHVKFIEPSRERGHYRLKCRIVSGDDLIRVACAINVLRHNRYKVRLEIMYLMGGRMDVRNSEYEPYTLKAICDIINGFDIESVSVFCPHSQATADLLHKYERMFDDDGSFFFQMGVNRCMDRLIPNIDSGMKFEGISLVFPDAGAAKRFGKMPFVGSWLNSNIVVMDKDRDRSTGKIMGMKIAEGAVKRVCVIVDDLCDGGATFRGCGEILKERGAEFVGLVVAHGIFSKGLPIGNVDYVFTSNSFCEWGKSLALNVEPRKLSVYNLQTGEVRC